VREKFASAETPSGTCGPVFVPSGRHGPLVAGARMLKTGGKNCGSLVGG